MLHMNHFTSNDRTPKHLNPTTPNQKWKNIDFPLSPTTNQDYRKEGNQLPLSPQPHYYPKNPEKSLAFSREDLEGVVRQLNEKMIKMSQKLSQHESILLKMSESSLENNKEELKRTHMRPESVKKCIDPLSEGLNKLKRQFEDYKMSYGGNEHSIQLGAIKELVLRSEEKMRGQMQMMLKKNSSLLSKTPNLQDRVEEAERLIRKLQKGVSLNVNKIGGLSDRIESINSSIDGHMDLINIEVNKAISKIVTFVNQKMSKPLNESIENLTQKIDSLELQHRMLVQKVEAVQIESKTLAVPQNSHFGGMKSSQLKSHREMTRAEYRETLTAYNQEIIISENTYYIDSDGYLLDRQFFYLVKADEERIRLDEKQIQMLMSERLLD